MRLFILDNGNLEYDADIHVAFSSQATIKDREPRRTWLRIPVYSVLIDHPDGAILYGTGCSSNSMYGKWPELRTLEYNYIHSEEQRLENQLAKTGLKNTDIRAVVLSNMHLDHTGNLDMFKHVEAVFVPKDDFANGLVMTHKDPDPNNHGRYIRYDLEVSCKYKLIEEEIEIVQGVELINLPGYTPGLLGMVVQLRKDGTLIFPGSALFCRENYGPPIRLPGVLYNNVAYRRSVEKIRRLEKKYQAKIMFSHDSEFYRIVKLAPDYYE